MGSAVRRSDNGETSVDGITERDPIPGIPECNAIEEGSRIRVLELNGPGFAAVDRLVDAGAFALTNTQKIGNICCIDLP